MKQADIDRRIWAAVSGVDCLATCKTKLEVAIGAQLLHNTTQMPSINGELRLWGTVSLQTKITITTHKKWKEIASFSIELVST